MNMNRSSALRRWIGVALRAALVSLAVSLAGPAVHASPAAAASATVAPPAGAPEAVVKRASDAIQQTLVANRKIYSSEPDRVHALVDAALVAAVDYDGIAKSVMASSYKSATAAQRKRFAEVFHISLVKTYTRAMLQFVDYRIGLLPGSAQERRPGKSTVKMQAVGQDGQTYPMEYSVVRMPAGDWRVRNVIVNGINLGLTYRNQFAEALRSPANKGDIDKVIAGWTTAQVVPRDAAKQPVGQR